MATGKALVDQLLAEKKVVVISKSSCPYCVKGKNVLKKYPIKPEDITILEIDRRSDCGEIQAYVQQLTGARSVPRVFIGGKCIGGGDETSMMHSKKKLGPMLEAVGAL